MDNRIPDREERVQTSIYRATMNMSVTALGIVAIMEIIMFVYSFINLPLYHGFQWRYRAFYLSLPAVAAAS